MSGHSKWATTKHKKAIIDSRRAKVFAKQIRAIEVAARNGGADMDGNPTLFDAVAKAKKSSMPADNIDRAIKRGAGLEAGAEEVNDLGEAFEIVSEPVDLVPVRTALQSAGIDYESADSSFLPSMSIPLDADGAKKVFELIDAIEELDDVQNVYSNFDVSDEVMASLD